MNSVLDTKTVKILTVSRLRIKKKSNMCYVEGRGHINKRIRLT